MSGADWLKSSFNKPENSNNDEASSGPAPPDVGQMPTTLFGKSFGQSKDAKGLVAAPPGLGSAAPPGLEPPSQEATSTGTVAGAALLNLLKPQGKPGVGAPPGLEEPGNATGGYLSSSSATNGKSEESTGQHEGVIKSYDPNKGYGFIKCDETYQEFGKDIFVHSSRIKNGQIGDVVNFTVKLHKGTPQADSVTVIDHEVGDRGPSAPGSLSTKQQPQEQQDPNAPRYTGTLKTFDGKFGFIACSDLHEKHGKDVFLHESERNSASPGDFLSFCVKMHKGSPQAYSVRVEEAPSQEDKPQGKRYYGTIKSFNETKGFGFVHCPEVSDQHDGKDIFVHAKSLNGAEVGDKVSFSCALRKGAPQAQDVMVIECIPEAEKPTKISSDGWKYDNSGLDGHVTPHVKKDAKKQKESTHAEQRPTREDKFEKKYDAYLSDEEIEKGLADGTFMKGELRMTERQTLAFVKREGSPKDEPDYCIRGKLHRNRAVHGDIIIFRALEEGEIVEHTAGRRNIRNPKPSADLEDDDDEDGFNDDLDSDEEIPFVSAGKPEKDSAASSSQQHGKGKKEQIHPPAKVLAIADFKGRNRTLTCTLHPNHKSKSSADDAEEDQDQNPKEGYVLEGDKTIKAIPFDKRLPWILIQINDTTKSILNIPGRLDKFRYWPVKILGWDEYSTLPIGILKGASFGAVGSIEAETRAALCESQLDSHDVDFEEDNLNETDEIVVHADLDFENECKYRKDLRKKRICTIDPATAKDLDDAIHIDIVGNQAEIGVHIADVGHFLKIGSATDLEAQRRTTSVYLIDRVLPMLPHALCNHLCSLNPNEAKLAFSAFFRLDLETGKLVDDPAPWFAKTVIKCCCRMNYEEVQDVLDGNEIEPPRCFNGHKWEDVKSDLFRLYDVCGKVRRNRFEGEDGQGGALSITKVQMIFHTRESEDGIPTGYHLEDHSASHWIIEELMLMANKVVARHIANSPLRDVAVLRNHQAPDPKKAEKLNKLLLALGIDYWDASTAGNLHKSLKRINNQYGETLGICVETMAMINGMQQATYFPVGNGESPWHYALDFDHYTHFTSPIRRYPDVMVHRVLHAVIKQEEAPMDMEKTESQCEKSNEKKKATRECKALLDRAVFCVFLRAQKNWFYTVGTVLMIKRDEMSVYSSQLGKEKSISFYYANNPDNEDFRMKPPPSLFMAGVDDELLLPETLTKKSISHVEVTWINPQDRGERKNQHLRLLSNVPIVIIPTDTVPIDFAMFLVSPFHRYYEPVASKEARGFDIREDDQDGVEEMWNAPHRGGPSEGAGRDPGIFE